MGLYDRDYTQESYQSQFGSAPRMRIGLPRITPVVKWLLIINFLVYLAQVLGADDLLVRWFAVYPVSFWTALQIWRLITYQFLHGEIWHIFLNMLGLFFLGPSLERHWGSKKFLTFYLSCGVAGGLFYMLLVAVSFLPALIMIGASGAILGVFAACAILFPQFVVFIFIFPVPIRVAAIAFTAIYFLIVITRGANAGGHAAHLAGMAAGAVYVFSQSWRAKFGLKIRSHQWERKMKDRRNMQLELDRILQKVHDFGIHSLSSKEKKTLKRATELERMKNKL